MRRRVIGLAFTSLAIAGLAIDHPHGAEQSQRPGCPAEYQHGQTCTPRPPPGPVAREDPAREGAYAPDCGAPKDHDEADLCIQRDVLKAAEESARWAFAQAMFSAIGLFGLVLSVGFAGWAAFESRKSAEIARKSFTQIHRAWLFIERGGFDVVSGNAKSEATLAFTIVNHGSAPAIIDWYIAEIEQRETLIGTEALTGRPGRFQRDTIIPAGGRSETLTRTVTLPFDWAYADKGQIAYLYFRGSVRYEAAPGMEGHTNFCFLHIPDRGGFVRVHDERNTRS